MRKVKYRFFLDYEKEEKWINEMAKEGWHLEKFTTGRFVFTKGEPGTFIYRNEFLGNLSKKEKAEYFEFLQDSGATIVHEFFGWIYVKKPASEGTFELYTDASSKTAYYNRILNTFLVLFLANIAGAGTNFTLLGQSDTGVMHGVVAFFNLFVAVLLSIPMMKINKNKKKLQEL
jgi:hypothetical protein